MQQDDYAFPQARILFFSRSPEPGRTKTRLIPPLGAKGAAHLHITLLRDVIERAVAARLAPVELWCYPDCSHPLFQQLRQALDIVLCEQHGKDLGERMHHAFTRALGEANYALLCGTDCPGLNAQAISRCLSALATEYEAVMIPAEDGGYPAIGLRQPAPWLFKNMRWGDSGVAVRTRNRLATAGLRWSEPMRLWDVDDEADLARLRSAYPQIWQEISPFFFAATRAQGGG